MSRLHTLKTITASATLLFAFSLSLTSLAGAAPQKIAPASRVIAHRSARVSPPHAGVKLLEDILLRMRNLPQIAMSRNKQTFQYQQAQQTTAPAQGATDQLLAIRPKESSFKMKADRRKSTIAMAEPKGYESSYLAGAKESRRHDEFKSASSVEGSMRRQLRDNKDSSNSYAPSLATHAKARGNLQYPGSGLPSSSMGANFSNAYQASNTKGIQNFDQATREITERLSPEARQRLTSSTGKLFDVAKKLEEAQQLAQNMGRQSAPGGAGGSSGGYAGNYGRSPVVADERHAPQGSFRNEKKESAKVISTNPLITEYDKGSADSQSADEEKFTLGPAEKAAEKSQTIARALPAPAPAAPMSMPFSQSSDANASVSAQKPPAEPSLFKHVREFLNRDGSSVSNLRPQQEAAGMDKAKPIEIALLPPSVVTGIPLVRLGTSEQETNKALTGKGSINKTKVNDWSVWSLQKPGNDEVSLQIYTKNGQVQAIRIFDSSLISPDFGVKLGDDLGTVKQKFGEPSFILQEPQSRAGQNYVYPISQVSFQLAYTSKTTAPKVVSLLIFNAN